MADKVYVIDASEEGFKETVEILRQAGVTNKIIAGKIVGCPKCHLLIVEGDDCEYCWITSEHKEGCRFRRASTCPIAIKCESHHLDVCPECDACTCSAIGEDEVQKLHLDLHAP